MEPGLGIGFGFGLAPARTSAAPLCTRTVRRVSPVLTLPSKPSIPTAPPYLARVRVGVRVRQGVTKARRGGLGG